MIRNKKFQAFQQKFSITLKIGFSLNFKKPIPRHLKSEFSIKLQNFIRFINYLFYNPGGVTMEGLKLNIAGKFE